MDATILRFFEGIRSPVLTTIFGVFSMLGEAVVISAIVLVVFWLAPRRVGEQALVTVITSFGLNSFMKHVVARPRPYISGVVSKLDPPLGGALDEYASFPSGHTQMTTGFFGAVASRSKRVLVWVSCALTVLLIALSRLYFGVHYPSDVLMGFLCGALIALLWALVYRFAYRSRYFFLLGAAALSLLPLFFSPTQGYVQATGLLTGGAVSLVLLHFFSAYEKVDFPRRLWRIPVGLALLLVVFMLTMLFPKGSIFTLVKWFLLAFAAIFCAQMVFEKLQI